ncbi:hypothetical protein JQ617_07015 [Bradyrhizobium sp. KB893862 SZCCT0404]|uniref:hypothetical protein n=1 Tax=Bradyrhizobium sp. KB893862 SZCCT0404 TaxID=2807672 RepID=UPI001BAB1946|nr:hypothetical protein [Bradyrhizobium sp. KB893862 SZCCT0404]MBR1173701.1 hypothetical protein [Bradyrhizobium sp. KB893862 SZCCT0404]
MATEPKTIRETSIVIQGVVDRLDLVQKMTWGVIGLLGTLIAGAVALYFQIGDLKVDVAVVKANFGFLKEQQTAIQEALRSIDIKTQASLSRIEGKVGSAMPPSAVDLPLQLAADEIAFLRTALKPVKTDTPLSTRVGDEITSRLEVLPRVVVDKIPQLASFSFTYDRSGAVLLVSNRTRRVVQIIEVA